MENGDWYCSWGEKNCPVCIPPHLQKQDQQQFSKEELKKLHLKMLQSDNEIILIES